MSLPTSSFSSSINQDDRGFTILEMLIVLAIVALATTLAAGSLAPRNRENNSSDEIAQLRAAQSSAIGKGITTPVSVGSTTASDLSVLLAGALILCVPKRSTQDEPRITFLGNGAVLVSGDASALPEHCLALDAGP